MEPTQKTGSRVVAALIGGDMRDTHKTFFSELIKQGIRVVKDYAHGDYCSGCLDAKAARLLRSDPAAIVTADTPSTLAAINAKQAARREDIPIIVAVIGNPTLDPLFNAVPEIYGVLRRSWFSATRSW